MIFFVIAALLAIPAAAQEQPATAELRWNMLDGMFKMNVKLEPDVDAWQRADSAQGPFGEYRGAGYRLMLEKETLGGRGCVVRYEITRTDGKPFRVVHVEVECKRSYSGVYKMFCPSTMAQQNYRLDLPFGMTGESSATNNAPVIWMQQTDGRNVLTLGMLDQLPFTKLEGRTYSEANGGEAPGIANSYVRATIQREGSGERKATSYRDGIYVNADPEIAWDDALRGYSAAVDRARDFEPRPAGAAAFNPMWHSWYAHGGEINEKQLRDDARRAAALGVKTIEIDAGWNMIGWDYAKEGYHDFEPARFPDAKGMIDEMHKLGLKVILHVSPLLMGPQAKSYPEMKDCLSAAGGKRMHLDPRYKKVHDYLLKSWEKLYVEYGIDGMWYDFLELKKDDPPREGMELVSTDLAEGYTLLMQALYKRSLELNPDAVIVLRRGSANLNAKTYCTHVWPMDTPQDYNMNRRDVVYMKTYGEGVLTHACCTSWAISESDENVARQMASIVLAGVPAFSVKLAESPASHNEIIAAWLRYYEPNQRDLVLGRMTPLLPTPPSAAIRIEGDKQAFFGFFEAAPGLVNVTRPMEKITLVNAFSDRTFTRIEGSSDGEYKLEVFDQAWKPISTSRLASDRGGLTIDVHGPSRCHSMVITQEKNIFAKSNLVAWCIVPYDAANRGPQERAELLKRLGIRKFAYDWRKMHVPTFEDEIIQMKRHGIEYFAFWGFHQAMVPLITKHRVHPQFWTVIPSPEAASQAEKVETAAMQLLPKVQQARELGCKLGLYNHGDWGGEPENMVAVAKRLREKTGADLVGIVYNFHHGHEHVSNFAEAMAAMKPYLLCVNLNGMSENPREKILPIGSGAHEKAMMEIVKRSGYSGPIGILGHRMDVDAEDALQQNLDGLKRLLKEMGDDKALKTYD